MSDDALPPVQVPFPTSLCHQCVHKRDVQAARSSFLRCVKLETKYAPQPVRACPMFEPAPPVSP